MTPNERKIERTFVVGERISGASAPDTLIQRLHQIPGTVRDQYAKVPKKLVWAVAASIAVLIVLNVLSAREYAKEENSSQETETYFDHLKTL